MRINWNFRNLPSQGLRVVPVPARKSSWKALLGHLNLEVFLSQVKSKLFKEIKVSLKFSKFSQEEWRAVRSVAEDSSLVIKKADKGSCVVVWDRWDHIKEVEKQLRDSTVFEKINYNEKILS